MINPATIASNNQYSSERSRERDSRPSYGGRGGDYKPYDPSKPTNLFVGNLQPWMDESYLQQVFAKFGEIKSTKIVRDRVSQQPMGYGFVDFGDHDIAKKVLDTWDELSELGEGQNNNAKLKLNWGVRGGGYNVRNLNDRGRGGDRHERRGGNNSSQSGEVSVSLPIFLTPKYSRGFYFRETLGSGNLTWLILVKFLTQDKTKN
jgi:RNA recognition motif-containing protein